MATLERDGPAPPADAPDASGLSARTWALRLLLFAGLVAVTVVAFPRERAALLVYEGGEAWRGETLRAPYDLAIQKDAEQLTAERRRVRAEVVPIVREEPGASARVRVRRDSLASAFAALFAQYDRVGAALVRGDRAQTSLDSVRFEALRRRLPVALSPEAWQALLAVHVAGDDSLAVTRLLREAEGVALEIAARGAFDVPRDSLRGDAVFVRSDETRTDRLQPTRTLYARDEAERLAARVFSERYPGTDIRAETGAAFARALLAPTYVYLAAETAAEVQRRLRALPVTLGEVRAGEVIVERGERVTPEVRRRIVSLDVARATREGAQGLTQAISGQAMLAGAVFLQLFLFLALLRPGIFGGDRQMTAISLLVGGVVVLFGLAVRLAAIEMLAVPMAIAAILVTVMFDSRVGVFVTVTLALIGGLLLRFDLGFTFTTLFGVVLVVFSVRDVRKRGQLFGSALLLFAAFATSLGGQLLTGHLSPDRFGGELANAGVHAFLVLLTYPLLWVAERIFGVTTDVTLLELSGTDHPLLRELQAKAPGTFSHTLQVAALAEAAAAAIGANRLLARVGALYHDVGKMARPQYFVENQGRGENPHAALRPHLSARIIADHVREGTALAREHKLPLVVQAFIPMHHGTTRIEYFYRRAVEEVKDGDPPVNEADFRYAGPRPTTREAAILMLADGVEAAARALDDPAPHRIEALVGQIVEARRADGQLDRSPLTFEDLRIVRETLTRALVSHYHSRIKYPGAAPERPAKTRRVDGA